MKLSIPNRLQIYYVFLLILGTVSTAYISLRTTIEKPRYPDVKLKRSLEKLGAATISSVKRQDIKKDSSDRKLSDLYTYKFSDGSTIHAVIVRVAKKDDLKIEGYGLLTKDIPSIYIKYPRFTDKVPFSMVGAIDNKMSYQTCLIPKTEKLDQVDVRLFPLRDTVSKIAKHEKSFSSRILGSMHATDLSCLVVTYQPNQSAASHLVSNAWTSLLQSLQSSLL